MTNTHFDRERLAGYEPSILKQACVGICGCGALANNVVQCFALAGVGEMRLIDFDFIEASNLTRSPLFAHLRRRGMSKRVNKAKELALSSLELSYAEEPVVRFAPMRIEELGLGAFHGCDAVVAAVDNAGVRAMLAESTRLLSIPMVEAGFSGLRGNVSAYANSDPDEPCYCCLNPSAIPEHVSCATYAAAVVADGRIPATQTIAALTGALVAEAVIQFLHGECSLSGTVLAIDAKTWRTTTLKLARDPACHCAHRSIDAVVPIAVLPSEPVSKIFKALPTLQDPEILLPSAFVVSMPCAVCGARVRIGKPEWGISGTPHCASCKLASVEDPASLDIRATVTPDSPLAQMKSSKLGLSALSIVEVFDRASRRSLWVQLGGGIEDLYVTRRRRELVSAIGNQDTAQGMNQDETDHGFRLI